MLRFAKKEEPIDEKALLRKAALGKLNYLSRKRFNKKTIDDIYWILNIFFKNYFKVRGEVSYTELIEKIKKKRIDDRVKGRVADLINFFLEAKYKNKRYTTKDLRNIVKEAKNVIKVI